MVVNCLSSDLAMSGVSKFVVAVRIAARSKRDCVCLPSSNEKNVRARLSIIP